MSGDSRQDLHNICHPIIKCLEWYPLSVLSSILLEAFQKGLQNLKQSYEEHSLINHTIEHYIGLVNGKTYESIDDNAVISASKICGQKKNYRYYKQ